MRAIRDRQATVDVPGYLGVMYLFYALAPGAMRWLFRLGKGGQRAYGQVEWRYKPQNRTTEDSS